MKKLFPLIIGVLLASCSGEQLTAPEPETCPVIKISDADLLIDAQAQSIDVSDASKVATLFLNRDARHKSRSTDYSSASPSVETKLDSATGKPLLYIVNWPDNGGFAIISASKLMPPVMAYSETGNFIYNAESASSLLLDGMISSAKYALENQGDSTLHANALTWTGFEKPLGEAHILNSRASENEINQMISTKIAKMQAKGYKYCGSLEWARQYLPASDYEALCMDISSHHDPQYDYTRTTLCFTKDEYDENIGPFLKTQWHQWFPFNTAINRDSALVNHVVAGCDPIAIAQICYYNRFPAKYNWSAIPVNPIFECDALTVLMKDITSYCKSKASYGKPGSDNGPSTATLLSDSRNALIALGYNVTPISNIDRQTMKTAIRNGKVFYMRGGSSHKNVGHAWVCDGYQDAKKTALISFVSNPRFILEQDPGDPYYDYPVKYLGYPGPGVSANAAFTDCFHMNLGKNGTSDGWYLITSYGGSIAGYEKDLLMMIPSKP